MWQGASAAKVDATRGYGASVDLEAAGPGRGVRAAARARGADGARLRASVRRSRRDRRRRARSGSRSSRTCPASTRSSSPAAAAASSPGIAAACVPAGVRVVAVEPERSNALALGLAAGEPVPVDAGDDRRRADRAVHRAAPDRDLRGARRRASCSSRRTRSGRRFGSSTAAPSSPPSRAARPPTAAVLAGKVEGANVVSVVSGGNVSADIASAILARP